MNTQGSLESNLHLYTRHACFGVCVTASAAVLWRPLQALMTYSFSHESYSHMVLIPIVTAYLLFVERRNVFGDSSTSAWPGAILIVSATLLYRFAGRHWSVQENSGALSAAALSLVLIWIGGFLLCYGQRSLRAAIFPMLFLVLMVPLPDALLERAIYLLQAGSTDVAYLLFNIVGVPVMRHGFILSLPSLNIEVAKECSGIRSSVALLITCLVAAHMFLKTWWKMTLFVLLVIPLAIIKNGIRIVTLTLLSLQVDTGFLTGRLHHEGGFVFFLLALALLAPVLLLLRKSENHRKSSRLPS